MKRLKSKWLLALVPVFFVVNVGFFSHPGDSYFEISKNLDIFGKLYREVHSYYVDEVEPGKFMREGIDAMLESLDPYTNFISASEIEDYKFMSTGQYGGIGAVIGKRKGKIIITEPYEGYPADKAGLRAGDVIMQIDDEVVRDTEVATMDVRNLLRGQPNTKVQLKIKRDGVEAPFNVDVTRDDIKIKNVPHYSMIDDQVGYIALTGFTNGASKEVKSAYQALKKDNPGLKGVVLDLRSNPGGLLFEAIDISNLFVASGEKIVETRGKIEGSLKTYFAKNQPIDLDIPLAVLINRRSASASEIVSGVMQDLDRGVVVGQRSFGKGLVQTTRPLSYNAQLKITTAKYYTPSGRCIQAIDYSHRNEDGSVGKIADSLKKEFKTAAGRSVFDGGGVSPDIAIEEPEYHTVTQEVVRQSMVFDFATKFRNENESIASAQSFKISDAIYNDFIAYCESREFAFDTKTEKEFTKLEKLMEEEAYADDLTSEIEAMRQKIDRQKENDLITYKEEISHFLKREIVSRYYYQKGGIEASFDLDQEVREAVSILKDDSRYKKLLGKG